MSKAKEKQKDTITDTFGADPLFDEAEIESIFPDTEEEAAAKRAKTKSTVTKSKAKAKTKSPSKEQPKSNSPFKKTILTEIKQIVIVYGEEGSGKTDFALRTSPTPHYVLDTEGGHNLVTAAKVDPDHLAVTIRDQSGRRPSLQWFSPAFGLWTQLESMVEVLLQDDIEPGTVLLDSGSDILGMAVAEMNIEWERGDKAFPPMLYGQVYGLIGTLIHDLRSKHHVVMTARVKDEYVSNERTGRLKLDMWRQGVYNSEHVVRISIDDNWERVYGVEKGDLMGILTKKGLSWKDLMTGNKKPYMKETEKIRSEQERGLLGETVEKAWKALTDKGIKFEQEDISSMSVEDAHKYIQSLRELFKQGKQ